MSNELISGSDILLKSLLAEDVDTIFGYPGGQVIPIFDRLYDYKKDFNYMLVRHEQGATHAAQGYARACGKVGVCLVTSGPGATNTITGIADAMLDSTPIVVIMGQVPSSMLGTDAFQEVDVVGITSPITKWSYQIRNIDEISEAVAKAFYIANTGRKGPVVLDFTKNAQIEKSVFSHKKCEFIRSYIPVPDVNEKKVYQAADLINNSKKPLMLVGQGVILSEAEKEVMALAEKADIPMAFTLMGESAIPTAHPLNKGMLGMHGNVGPNSKTNEADLLIAVGMRFSDRVTGNLKTYAKQAKIIHFDIDPSEIGKNVPVDVAVLGDAKENIKMVGDIIKPNKHTEWIESFKVQEEKEFTRVIQKELYSDKPYLTMGEAVNKISEATNHEAILVTDVGQNQIAAARYFKFKNTRSMITSGGLGTMGFGIPAAIGAKIAQPNKTVCMFCGDGGFQMTMQELGTIMQYKVGVKMIILNNNKLGMVRQWQELFFNERYSSTNMENPNFGLIAESYKIRHSEVHTREELDAAIADMLSDDEAYLLTVNVEEKGLIYPMIPAGASVSNILLNK